MSVDADLLAAFKLPPPQALAYLKAKGYALTWDYWDLWQAAHARAFTVAKVAQLDILVDIRTALTEAMEQGLTEREFVKRLTPTLKRKGWWGRLPLFEDDGTTPVLDADGVQRTFQAGSPWRLRTIYRVNTRTAMQTGRWRAFEAAKTDRPWLMYVAIMDSRVRESHAALNARIFAFDDPIWRTHAPPNGWNCRCRLRSLSDAAIERRGLRDRIGRSDGALSQTEQRVGIDRRTGEEITRPGTTWTDPLDDNNRLTPDPGWSYNPAQSGADEINRLLREKATTLGLDPDAILAGYLPPERPARQEPDQAAGPQPDPEPPAGDA